jgi:hypothetical protein
LYYQFVIGTEPLLTPAYSSFVATRPTLVQLWLALNLSKMQSHITMTVGTANFYFK